jgi:hypothetical protein
MGAMVPITVHFRGPMLFVSRENLDTVEKIIIPDARKARCHEDRTTAESHVAALLIMEGNNEKKRISLNGKHRLTIRADGLAGKPTTDALTKRRST